MGGKKGGGTREIIREVPAPAPAPADYSNVDQRKAAVAASTNSQTSSTGGTFGAELASGGTAATNTGGPM